MVIHTNTPRLQQIIGTPLTPTVVIIIVDDLLRAKRETKSLISLFAGLPDYNTLRMMMERWNNAISLYPQLLEFDWSDPSDVMVIAQYFQRKGLWNSEVKSALNIFIDEQGRRLPNLCLLVEPKQLVGLDQFIRNLLNLRYDDTDIHLLFAPSSTKIVTTQKAKPNLKLYTSTYVDVHRMLLRTMGNTIGGGVYFLHDNRKCEVYARTPTTGHEFLQEAVETRQRFSIVTLKRPRQISILAPDRVVEGISKPLLSIKESK